LVRRLGDAPALDAHPAQHFIFHLYQIPWVEEVAPHEGGIPHRFGMRVDRAARGERRELLIGCFAPCHVM
jgi:hypothetical protein